MSYIGTTPPQTFSTATSQSFSGNGSTTVFTLNRAVNRNEDLEVFVENVQQKPATSYTASGTTLDFGSGNAPSSGTNNIYVIFRNFAIPSAGGPSLANNNSFAGVNNFAQPIVNSGTIASDITIASGERAMMAGDISINSSTTVTVNGVLTIV